MSLAASLAGAIAAVLIAATPADASNDALLKLLQVLRDRGSLTAKEYEDIRLVAEAGEPAPPKADAAAPVPAQSPAPAPAVAAAAMPERVALLEQRVADQDKALTGLKAATDGTTPPVVARALAGKWYERIGLRGYTQMRYSDVLNQQGPALEVPADRSVNANESFLIRRGRFVFSGDPTSHLSLYAQADFNGSTGAADYSLQMRDLYGDIWLTKDKNYRVRVGQSKVPFGWVNMQSSQNRAPFERPDALNSAVEGERDLGAALMWNNSAARQRFRDLTNLGLKGSGDYGVFALGLYSGQGLNRPDQNGNPHVVARASYPFKLASGQFVELGVQGYHGRFVSPTQAVTVNGASVTPTERADGVLDERVGVTAVVYPQPFGVEAEWTWGRGPQLSADSRLIDAASLHGGYVQLNYRKVNAFGTWFPFTRWQYYQGGRKFARNAPGERINEVDFGLEFAHWAELEVTGMFTHTFQRTRTGTFPYTATRDANRIGIQAQWNY
jgi:hypothetical protein